MRCRQHNYRYALFVQHTSGEDWQTEKINMIVAKMSWCPAADVYEVNDKIYVTLEIAGVDFDSIEIVLYEDAMVVEGKRFLPSIPAKGVYHIAEIRQGSFCFELPLSISVKPEQVESNYENGLLAIIIKKNPSKL
jgi:HSP20 family protein